MPVLRDPTGTTMRDLLAVPANRDADLIMDRDLDIRLKIEGGGSGQGGTISEDDLRSTVELLLGL